MFCHSWQSFRDGGLFIVTLFDAALADLRRGFSGSLLLPDGPDGPEFEQARRVWKGMIIGRPALIAACRTATDVSSVIQFAHAAGRQITVRCGGHNVAGSAVADDAVMVDLSPMRDV